MTLFIVRPWHGAAGMDVYYYALQTKALRINGHLLFSDFSPVYYFSLFVDLVVNNPVLTSQIVSIISALTCFVSVMITLKRKSNFSLFLPALLITVNSLFFFLQWEFLKNLFALALFLSGYALLEKKNGKYSVPGIILIALSCFSHRLITLVVLLFALQFLVRFAIAKIKKPGYLYILFGAGAVFIISGLILSRQLWYDRLSSLSFNALVSRIQMMSGGILYLSQKIFFLMIQILIPLSLILFFIRNPFKNRGEEFLKPGFIFFLLSQICVFPFLEFTWDGIGFRLLIMAPVFWGIWILVTFKKIRLPFQIIMAALLGFIIIQGILLNQDNRSPDYKTMDREFAGIEKAAEGKRLIAHRGLAGFLWFGKGIWTENFIPMDYGEDKDNWYRLVYAFKKEIFKNYIEEDEELPGFSAGNYLLIQEEIWQRFYQKKKDLIFLQSELNPNLPRPETAFRIHRETAVKLSPVSFPDTDNQSQTPQ